MISGRGLALIVCLLPWPCQAENLTPFTAHYKAEIGSFTARATRSLSLNEQKQWVLSQRAENLFASITESSEFHFEQPQLRSQRYEYLRKVFGSKRHALLTFDWHTKRVTNDVQDKPWSYDIEQGTLDKLNYQLQLRMDLMQESKLPLHYAVADGGVLKQYHFEVIGEEQLATELGELETIKVQRIYPGNNKKETLLWFAKELDYLLVKYQQTNEKGKSSHLLITSVEDKPS